MSRSGLSPLCSCRGAVVQEGGVPGGAEAVDPDPLRLLHDLQRSRGQATVGGAAGSPQAAILCVLSGGCDGGRVVAEAMSGRYLDKSFSLPCPPGLDVPPEVFSPFTSNNLKVRAHPVPPVGALNSSFVHFTLILLDVLASDNTGLVFFCSSCCCWAASPSSGLCITPWRSRWATWTRGPSSAGAEDRGGAEPPEGGGSRCLRRRPAKKRSKTRGRSCRRWWTLRPKRSL